MKISGVMPLRNVVKLGYPLELAVRSLRPLCDEVVLLVDPASEDDTVERARALSPDVLVESAWDMSNYDGHRNCEVSVQTQKAVNAASGDWVLSLQADEVLHGGEAAALRATVDDADRRGVTGLELERLYFYGGLDQVREDWTQWLLRLFKRGLWAPSVDGAHTFDPVGSQERRRAAARVYHYSRVGDPRLVAERVRNLDRLFHPPGAVREGSLEPYDYSTLRKLDTYAVGHASEVDPKARLVPFDLGGHPAGVLEQFGGLV